MNRRNFIRTAAGLLVAAPMVVRASSLMPVKKIIAPPPIFTGEIGNFFGVTIIYGAGIGIDRTVGHMSGDTFIMRDCWSELVPLNYRRLTT